MALQNNNYSIVGEEATPLILKYLEPSTLTKEEKALYKMLQTWDFNYVKEAKAPVVAKAVLDTAMQLTFDELLQRPDSVELMLPELWRFLSLLEAHPQHPIFDRANTPAIEDATAIIREAFAQAAKDLYVPLTKEGLDWGKVNAPTVAHLLRLPAFSKPMYVDGFSNALNASSKRGSGPSWRMVVELGTPIKAYGVYPGGQSGNPGSPFYETMVDQWGTGKYNKLNFMKDSKDKLPQVARTWNFKKA